MSDGDNATPGRGGGSGPSDDEGWTMLAGNPAVAAKLRQLQPRLEAALKQKGFQRTGIRIRVQSPTNP